MVIAIKLEYIQLTKNLTFKTRMILSKALRNLYHQSIKFTHGKNRYNHGAEQSSQLKMSPNKIKLTNRAALNAALDEQIQRNPKVFLIGQQVAQYNGAYKISKGLFDKYGQKRIVDTPITQMGFTGLAVGASLMGLTPVVEFMTWNFALQSIDHIINSCAKTRYMSSNELGGGIVFRGLNGPAAAVAAQHSQCFASYFANIPGLVTISPYDAEDCKGLLKSAIRCNQPVIFLENQNLYGETYEVSETVMDKEFTVPIGKAKIMRQGKDLTIVAFSRNVKFSLEAAQELQKQGISAQVINLRTIRPLDRDTIVQSVKKTGRLVTVEDGFPFSGIGAQIIATINETRAFDWLIGPIQRVTSIDIPMPYASNLQEAVVPRSPTILKAALKVMQFK